ncbi:MAG: hypothetical protein IPO60_09560 [Flavobacteriales bacterium]|nr:hypothetical protein [Flavobacteriales bacterium]
MPAPELPPHRLGEHRGTDHRRRQHRGGSEQRRASGSPAVTFAEVLATSDLPGGVVNLITGLRSELLSRW